MDCTSTRLPYRQTGYFNKIVLDYIDQAGALEPFIAHAPTRKGVEDAIEARKKFPTNRQTLVKELKSQYAAVAAVNAVEDNINSLLSENTFTITTAHQNNIFTGPLYFIYKILHTIKLAAHLKSLMPEHNFVPVFYIGSEDADLDELNNIHLNGEKLSWLTKQKGAVGRMKIDAELLKIIDRMEGELSVQPSGNTFIEMLRRFYVKGQDIQTATFHFVNELFAEYGLIVLLPDNAALKKQMISLFEDDLLHQSAAGIVEGTAAALLKAGYKVQAHPREINLFYLKDDTRERIEQKNGKFYIHNTSLSFTKEEMLAELQHNPERFSPNVILRGIYQETILPNIVFIGGGGEIAYWLQLKALFQHHKAPYPVLLVRNSFLLIETKWSEKIGKLGFTIEEFFLPEEELFNRWIRRESNHDTKLNGSLPKVEELYENFKTQASAIDVTLAPHVEALKSKTVHRLRELEKKMLRAEKRKFADQQRKIHEIKEQLFPGNGLQERYDNIGYYYAKWGKEIIALLYQHSMNLEQEFVVLTEK
jgi:bacillithiol biosynthesis cysteine-adding enzyme BshC